jgi:hypothetical protein
MTSARLDLLTIHFQNSHPCRDSNPGPEGRWPNASDRIRLFV